MRKRIALFFLLLIFLAGCLISLFPVINERLYKEKMKTTVSEFQSNTGHQQPPVIILPSGDAETTEYTPAIHQELWNDIQQYNRRLFQTRQEGIKGLESLEEASFRLSDYGITGEVFGVLSIRLLIWRCQCTSVHPARIWRWEQPSWGRPVFQWEGRTQTRLSRVIGDGMARITFGTLPSWCRETASR